MAKINELVEGDVVTLKSGSAQMTIMHFRQKEMATCAWFRDGFVQEHTFSVFSLEKVQ